MPAPRSRRYHLSALWLALPVALLLPLRASAAPVGALPPPPTTPQQKTLLVQMQDAFTGIAESVEPSVVNIKSERVRAGDGADGGTEGPVLPGPKSGHPGLPLGPGGSGRSQATGSGVIVRSDGYILTNDHVVDGATGGVVTVTLADGREFTGKVFPDFRSDLAVVKIDAGTTPLPAATFAPSDSVRSGQWAIAVGSPFDLQNTVTVGIISALGRHQSIGGESAARYYPDLIQTDAAINPGNSGGPLVDANGRVIGVNTAIASLASGSSGREAGSIGIGFAIPINQARRIATELVQTGQATQAVLGVSVQNGQPRGATLAVVTPGSPAQVAGLQSGDVVTRVDHRVVQDANAFVAAIQSTPPGQVVTLTIGNGAREVAVTLGSRVIGSR